MAAMYFPVRVQHLKKSWSECNYFFSQKMTSQVSAFVIHDHNNGIFLGVISQVCA